MRIGGCGREFSLGGVALAACVGEALLAARQGPARPLAWIVRRFPCKTGWSRMPVEAVPRETACVANRSGELSVLVAALASLGRAAGRAAHRSRADAASASGRWTG